MMWSRFRWCLFFPSRKIYVWSQLKRNAKFTFSQNRAEHQDYDWTRRRKISTYFIIRSLCFYFALTPGVLWLHRWCLDDELVAEATEKFVFFSFWDDDERFRSHRAAHIHNHQRGFSPLQSSSALYLFASCMQHVVPVTAHTPVALGVEHIVSVGSHSHAATRSHTHTRTDGTGSSRTRMIRDIVWWCGRLHRILSPSVCCVGHSLTQYMQRC